MTGDHCVRTFLIVCFSLIVAAGLSACTFGGPPSQYPAIRYAYLDIGGRAYPIVPIADLAEAALHGLSDIDPAFTVRRAGTSIQLTLAGARLAEFAQPDAWEWPQPLEDALRLAFSASPAAAQLSSDDRQIVVINAMLRRANPRAAYIAPVEPAARQRAEAEVGFGVNWDRRDGRLTIQSVQPTGTAALYKVEPGDAITAINGHLVARLTDQQVAALLAAPIQRPTYVTMDRKSPARAREVFLGAGTRRGVIVWYEGLLLLQIPFIEPGPQGSSGGIALAQELQRLFARHESERLKGVVIDLRGNPGGRLYDAFQFADLFLPYGPVSVVKGRTRAQEQYFDSADGFGTFGTLISLESVPIVVMVDGRTSGGAEMLAGAIQLRQRGIILGTATRGSSQVDTPVSMAPAGLPGTIYIPTGQITLPGAQTLSAEGIAPTLCLYEMGADAPSRIEFGLTRMEPFAGRPRATLTPNDWARLKYLCPGDAKSADDDIAIAAMIASDPLLYNRVLQSVPPNHFARHEDYVRPR